MDINDAINLAISYHQAGDFQRAECSYREILQIDPNNFYAWHYLGLLYFQLKKLDSAIDSLQKAIKSKPDDSHVYYNLGMVYQESGKLEEAITEYQKALQFDSLNTDAYVNLGNIYKKKGLTDLAVSHYQKAIYLNPDHMQAYYNLGYLFQEEHRYDDAIAYYQKTLQLDPNLFAVYYNLGYIYHQRKQFDEAINCYMKTLQLNPDMADAYRNLGLAFYDKEEFDESIIYYQKALRLNPDFIDAYNNLGAIYQEQGNYHEAIIYYQKALELNPNVATAYSNLGNAFYSVGNDQEALIYFRKALLLNAHYVEAHANMSHVLLSQGNFHEGWKEYEWRLLKKESRSKIFLQPVWDGLPLQNKTLLVYAEQGIGDEIMFASCLPDVISMTDLCTVECDKRLIPLFTRSFHQCSIAGRIDYSNTDSPGPPLADLKIAIGSLPKLFRPDSKGFPQQKSYLIPDDQKVKKWIMRFSEIKARVKIGISWRGGSTPNVIRVRSTKLMQWAGLFSIPEIAFINLQYGDCSEELTNIEERLGVRIHTWEDTDPLKDLDDFAAEIAALDLVVSVDNATVHMAGALGVQAWVLLPYVCEWRWMKQVEDTPWYPTLRLYRQIIPGEWEDVFERVSSNLRQLVFIGKASVTEGNVESDKIS